eukprot:5467493-Alexandrium_andersonii.AAC.1
MCADTCMCACVNVASLAALAVHVLWPAEATKAGTRDRQRQTETDRDRQRQAETGRDRQRQTETDRDRQRQEETDRDRQRQTEASIESSRN